MPAESTPQTPQESRPEPCNPELCNVDGQIVPLAEAKVPVMDRGFLFGDSVYDVVVTRQGVPFAAREHMGRLHASAERLGMALDLPDDVALGRVKTTLERARELGATGESYVRIVVTRGSGAAPNIDLSYAIGPCRWVIITRPISRPAPTAKVALVPRLRNDRRALDPAIKSGNYLNNVLGLAEAKATGADECLFLNTEGQLTEASTSNVFVILGGELITPPLKAGLLEGITRALLKICCADLGLPVLERNISEAEFHAAEEVFLSGTTREVTPVTHRNGQAIGNGDPGPVTARIRDAFVAFSDARLAAEDRPFWESVQAC